MMGRFHTLDEVADSLSISMSQLRALVERGEIAATPSRGRGQCQIEDVQLQDFIERMYAEQQDKRSAGKPNAAKRTVARKDQPEQP